MFQFLVDGIICEYDSDNINIVWAENLLSTSHYQVVKTNLDKNGIIEVRKKIGKVYSSSSTHTF